MNHDKAREFFSAYYEGTLESGLRQQLEARFRADAHLKADYAAFVETIEALGELAAMSRASYARRFREAAGMTVFEFMTRTRMAIACDLLRSTRRNVGDICMEVGYQSEAAFGKAFKKHMAEMPGQYRRRQKSTP